MFFNECNILVYLKNKFTSSYLNVAKIYIMIKNYSRPGAGELQAVSSEVVPIISLP